MAGKKESALVAVISGLTSAQAAQMAKEIMKSTEKFAPHGRGTIAAGKTETVGRLLQSGLHKCIESVKK